MTNKIKIEGFNNLYRDENNGAIINSNIDEYKKYIESKKRREELYGTINEINNLKQEMEEIKSLLRELINKNGN